VILLVAVISALAAQNVKFETVIAAVEKLGGLKFEIHSTLEKAEADELAHILSTAKSMFEMQMAKEPQSRDAHAKGHGCAEAQFIVNANLPPELRAGVFQPGQTLDAIIRFSNGEGTTTTDGLPQGHGMAIKLIDGAKNGNILGTGTTQDFMLVDNPRFAVRSVKDYDLLEKLTLQKQKPVWVLTRAIREALAEAGRQDAEEIPDEKISQIVAAVITLEKAPQNLNNALSEIFGEQAAPIQAAILAKLGQMKAGQAPLELVIGTELSKVIGSSLTASYYSMTSYLFRANGFSDNAVKYSAHPVDCGTGEKLAPEAVPQGAGENYLSEGLVQSLNKTQACFDFSVQPLAASMSVETKQKLVEDARLNYETPEVVVARIVIPVQDVSLAAKKDYCANLSYNPWQASQELQPLGALNRARKVAVTASSIRRHLYLGKDRNEPASIMEYRNLK